MLARREVERPRTLGLVPATAGYIDRDDWEEIIDVQSKPIVAEELLAGRYEAGLTHLEHLAKHPDELRLDLEIGEIDTTWVVYGTRKRFQGEVIGIPSAEIFGRCPPVLALRLRRRLAGGLLPSRSPCWRRCSRRWRSRTGAA